MSPYCKEICNLLANRVPSMDKPVRKYLIPINNKDTRTNIDEHSFNTVVIKIPLKLVSASFFSNFYFFTKR